MDHNVIVANAEKRTMMVKDYLVNRGMYPYDRDARFPYGIAPKIAKEIGYKVGDVRNSLTQLKSEMPYNYRPEDVRCKSYYVKGDSTSINKQASVCLDDGLIRKASNLEVGACNTAVYALKDNLPPGGYGIYIGTPALFCASPDGRNNMLLDDNAQVYNMLKYTTTDDYPLVVIGGAVNERKAQVKGEQFKRTQSSCHSIVRICHLDAPSFYDIVREKCLQHELVKVVFQASGVWSFCRITQEKFPGLNLNFKAAAKRLTSKFPNLHILAMVRENQFGFDIRYLHRKQDIVLPRWKHPSLKKDK